jgi:hypothetical protein
VFFVHDHQAMAALNSGDDQDHSCCGIFKIESLFKMPNAGAQSIPTTPLPLPVSSDTNEDPRVEPEDSPGPSTQRTHEAKSSIIPKVTHALSKDDKFSQTLQEAKAKFRNAKDQLGKAISKPNSKSPIEVSRLDLNDIGNLPQMAQDIDLAISEFRMDRESRKGKGAANKWVHMESFAGQRGSGIAESIASVSYM